MKNTTRAIGWLVAILIVMIGPDAAAADFFSYATKPGWALKPPVTTTPGFSTLYGAFSSTTTVTIDGYALKGRLYAIDGGTIWLQKNFGASVWIKIATSSQRMDPGFMRVSPDGTTFAVGTSSGGPILVGPTQSFSVTNPPDIATTAGIKSLAADFFDATWRDNRYLFVNTFTTSKIFDFATKVYAVDTSLPDLGAGIVPILEEIPGASSGLTFDRFGSFITGNGFTAAPASSPTGQLKIWSADDIAAALAGAPLSYLASGHVIANAILNATSLGVDVSNNLFVGGGARFDTGDVGYAALVNASVLTRVLAGGAVADESKTSDYLEITADPCRNDDATQVQYVDALKMLLVTAKSTSVPPMCAAFDDFDDPAHTTIQLYFPGGAPDADGDGIPDGADNAYLTRNPDQSDADGDGFGDAVDVDFDDDDFVDENDFSVFVGAFASRVGDANFDPRADLDHDGKIDGADLVVFEKYWGKSAPFD